MSRQAPLSKDWLTQNAQIVAFRVDTLEGVNAEERWKQVVGSPPESSQRSIATAEARGQINGLDVLLRSEPHRETWVATIRIKPDETETNWPSLGSRDDVKKAFFDAIAPKIGEGFAIRRASIVEKMIMVTNNEKDSLAFMTKLLNGLKVAGLPRELLYRVNYPRPCKVIPNLLINRIASWQSGPLAFAAQVQMAGEKESRELTVMEGHGVVLGLDINTDQELKAAIPGTAIVNLYQELYSLADEIVRSGNIP